MLVCLVRHEASMPSPKSLLVRINACLLTKATLSPVVLELGSGAALPSLLAATREYPPSMVTITDHPDETIMNNLRENVARNRHAVSSNCRIYCLPYIWGDPPGPLLYVFCISQSIFRNKSKIEIESPFAILTVRRDMMSCSCRICSTLIHPTTN